MLAVVVDQPGGPEAMRLGPVPEPSLGEGEVLIEVAATAVNRADLLQRQGHYPPPPGASSILGLECSGTIAALGDGVSDWQVGDPVCALLSGGGYAAQVAVPATQVLPVPPGVDLVTAAGLPEVGSTVWSNLVMTAGLEAGETVLIHGGGSGIGTMAIQVAKAIGARVAVTASRDRTLEFCRSLGADITINHREQDFVAALAEATDGRGADVILDLIGAKYLQRNLSALAVDGRLVIIGLQGGTRTEVDLGLILTRRLTVYATTLRSRPRTGPHSKARVIEQVRDHLWPLIAAGRVRPIIDSTYPLAEVGAAHTRVAEGGHHGKVILTMDATVRTAPAQARGEAQ